MFCSKCGNQMFEKQNVCSRCGLALTEIDQVPVMNSHVFQPEQYAGFLLRVVATILDNMIIGVPLQFFVFSLIGVAFSSTDLMDSEAGQTIFSILITLFLIGVAFLYKTLMESSVKQATLGKMIVGIKVTDLQGNRITFARAVGRYFANFLNAYY